MAGYVIRYPKHKTNTRVSGGEDSRRHLSNTKCSYVGGSKINIIVFHSPCTMILNLHKVVLLLLHVLLYVLLFVLCMVLYMF
jgi:hypothetical protein